MFKMTNKLFVVSFYSSPAYIETLVTSHGDLCLLQNRKQVAQNIMYDGTHLLRQHNQLKWHCYFPLCSGIFLNTPSYLSLR